MTVHVLGGSGFVGSGVLHALDGAGRAVTSPRVTTSARNLSSLLAARASWRGETQTLARQWSDGDTVVVASGQPDATGGASDALYGANALLPLVALQAAEAAGCTRLVHVSSAVVQGDIAVLDSSREWRTATPYGTSKALAEQALLQLAATSPVEVVVYRPPSVHAESRRITRALTKIAGSPLAMVPRGNDAPSPQALLENVASAIVWLATRSGPVPELVHHPAEGVSVTSLMEDLGGRRPLRIPRWLAHAGDAALKRAGRTSAAFAPHSRRLEILWFGQGQAESWLTADGWTPVAGRERWRQIGRTVRAEG